MAPGRRDIDRTGERLARDLSRDIEEWRGVHDVGSVVCLLWKHEFKWLGIEGLFPALSGAGIEVVPFPIKDGWVPEDPPAVLELVRSIEQRLDRGVNVLVHCRSGLGRTGTISACMLVASGVAPDEAIASVRACRSGAIESEAQEQFVRAFPGALLSPGEPAG
jgi:protein-tyrosine phosphatase